MPATPPSPRVAEPPGRPGRTQTVFSASLLLMGSALLSGLLGLLRQKLIAHLFGAGTAVDAYKAAFELPDIIYYLLVGGVVSTTFVKLLTQYAAEGNEAEGDRALSNILNVMLAVLSGGLLLAAVLAPLYVRHKFPGFSPETQALTTHLSRILLLSPLLFFAGGVFASRLLVRKIFLYQAMQPVLYNGGIIAGAVLLSGRFGVAGLAYGALLGAFVGAFLMNAIGARRIGLRWTPSFDLRHPALGQWVRLSLPLMLGQSIVTVDSWIRSTFASHQPGAIAQLDYARQLFSAPMGVLGPAVGAASLPFFASLWSAGDVGRFSGAVNRSVVRLMAVGLLLTGWMIAMAKPIVDLSLRGGSFRGRDASITIELFTLFCVALVFWTSQNLYSRAFYSAGNTLVPMLSGTVVTIVSIPVYALLFRSMGLQGLVIASDLAIAAHTVALAVLLHRRRMVSLPEMEWAELGKALLASVCGASAASALLYRMPPAIGHGAHLLRMLLGSGLWLAVVYGLLRWTRSVLPDAVLRRKRATS